MTAQGRWASILPGGPRDGFSTSGPVDVTTPREPATGVETITLSRPGPSTFEYTTPLSIFMPQGAVITSVTNVAEDDNGVIRVPLGPVRHTDTNGVQASVPAGTCPQAPGLAPQDSTSRFNGLTVAGQWTARADCISNVFLRDFIQLEIAWQDP